MNIFKRIRGARSEQERINALEEVKKTQIREKAVTELMATDPAYPIVKAYIGLLSDLKMGKADFPDIDRKMNDMIDAALKAGKHSDLFDHIRSQLPFLTRPGHMDIYLEEMVNILATAESTYISEHPTGSVSEEKDPTEEAVEIPPDTPKVKDTPPVNLDAATKTLPAGVKAPTIPGGQPASPETSTSIRPEDRAKPPVAPAVKVEQTADPSSTDQGGEIPAKVSKDKDTDDDPDKDSDKDGDGDDDDKEGEEGSPQVKVVVKNENLLHRIVNRFNNEAFGFKKSKKSKKDGSTKGGTCKL